MLICRECGIVDVEPIIIERNREEYEVCVSCRAEDSFEEIDEQTWLEDMELDVADRFNEEMEFNFEIL